MHRLTLTLTLVLLPITRVAAQHAAAPGDTGTGPVIHGRAFSTGTREGWSNKAEFLFGIAHPLAPYKLHFP